MPFTDQQIEQFRSYGEAACADAIDAMTPEQQADLAQSVAAYNARKASQQQAQPKDTISQFSNTEYSRPAQKAPIVQQRDSSIDTYLAKNKVNYNMPGTGPAGMETSDPSLLAPEAWQREVKDFRLSNGAVTKVRSDRALWLDPSKGDPNKVPGWYWWTGSGWKVAPARPYGQEPDIAQLAANAPQVAWQQAKNIGHDIAETAQEFKEKPVESTATALATGLHEAAMPIKQATGLGLMGNYGAGRLIGVIPSEEKSKQWESELDKRGYHRLANAVRDYRENTNAMWESGKQLAMGADPALSESQQQELKEAQQTKPGEAGGLGGGLVSFLAPMGIAESAGAKVASTGMKLLPRIAARLGQGALTSAPHAFREYNDIKQQLIENGESEEDAESQALQQAAKDFGVSAPTTALLFSEKFGKAFMPKTKAMAFANRAARTGIITSAQVGLSNIVNDRPVTDNFMSTLLQNGVFEMSHVFGDAKMWERGAEIAKKYASLEEAKKALQADYVLAVMDHDTFRTKDTKTDLNNTIADLAALNTWGDRLKFNGNLTAEEAAKTQGGIKTLARRSVKLAEIGKGGTEDGSKPTDAIAPQEKASVAPEPSLEKPVSPKGEPNAIQEQGAGEMGAQPGGTEGAGEQAGGVRQGQQGVEAPREEGAKPEVLAEEAKEVNPKPRSISWFDLGSQKKDAIVNSVRSSIDEYAANPVKAVDDYRKIPDSMDGRIVSGDTSRMLHGDYLDNPNWGSGAFSDLGDGYLNQERSINRSIRDSAIKRAAEEGKDGAIMVGGQGSGKTTLAKELIGSDGNIGVVLDGLHMDRDEIHFLVEKMKREGVYPHVIFVDTPPERAFHNTLVRSEYEVRHVNPDFFIKAHDRAAKGFLGYADSNPEGVTFHRASLGDNGFDLSRGEDAVAAAREAKRLTPEELAEAVRKTYFEAKEKGNVPTDVARSIEAGSESIGSRGRGEVETENAEGNIGSGRTAPEEARGEEGNGSPMGREAIKSLVNDFYAGDINKYNRAGVYKDAELWNAKTPEEVNDRLLAYHEAKMDIKDPEYLAETFGGQAVYERIIKKMGLPEDASLREIGQYTMDKIKYLGKTVAETTNKILTRVAGIGRQAAEKLAQFLHNEWESFKNRDGQQGAVTMGNLKKRAVKIATQQLSDNVLTSVKPEDRTRAENMARMGLYAGEGSKYWKNMTPEQQKGIVEAQDAFIAQTKKALASFEPTRKFGRVRKTTAEYDRSRAIAFATKKYIDLRNDTLIEMERAGKIKLDPVERLNIHATQQLSSGLFADVSGKTLKEQRKYAKHLHRELARHSQGLDFATKHAANEVLNSQAGIDGDVAKEAYDFMDRVNAGLPVEESKLSKEAKDYIEKFVKPMQQINNGLYQGGQDMVGGDIVKDTAHIPHKFIGVVDEEGNIQPANKSMGLYRMRGIKPGAKNEIARTVEAGITENGQRLILNLKGDELASVWENGERIGIAHKTKNEAGEEVWTFREKGAYGKPIEMKLGRATIEEIEKNTPFRYAHNPVVALTDSIVGLSEASRAKAMIDALVTSNMVRHPMDAPKGWVELELSNVKGMMAPPDIASVLNDFHRSLNRRKDSSELVRAAKQMGRAFVNLGFINPMVHMPNVIAHGVTGRGAMAWLKPKSYASVAAALESSMESMGDTRINRLIRKGHDRLMAAVGVNVDPFRNRVFRNLVGLSGRMMNLDPKRTISLKSYNRIMGETIDAQPEAAKNLFEKYGIKSMDAVKEAVNDMSDKVWMADNMVRATMYLDAIAKAGVPVERMAGELTAKERELAQRAVEQVDRDGYPDYDIPAVGTMGRLGAHMKDSPLWLFTRFHWNTVKLVKNDTVDALKSINPKAWATPEGRKEIYHAADKVAAYVLMSAVIYPIMDMVYQKATGLDEEEIEFRRGGAFGAGHAVAGLFSGEQRAVGKFMNHMFTPSLPFSMGMDLYNSATSPMTGEEIVSLAKLRKAGEDIADNDFTGAAGDLGSFVMDPSEYLFFKAFSPAGTIRQGMKDYRGVQREDSEKAKAVLAAMFMGKVKNPNAETRTEKNYQRALKKIAKEEGND